MTFDPSKPLQTRDGSIKWDKEGRASVSFEFPDGQRDFDLINLPEPRVYYVTLAIGWGSIYLWNSSAATHRITLTEGCEPKIEEVK